jgi:hypothetical protein
MRRIWMVASFALVLPVVVKAQHHAGMGMGMSGTVVARPAGRVVSTAPRAGVVGAPRMVARVPAGTRPGSTVVHRTRTAGTPNRATSVDSGFGFTDGSGFSTQNVPGLGFDFPHLAAVNSRHGRDRDGFGQNAGFGFGGLLFGSPEVVVENPPVEEAPPQVAPDDNGAGNPGGYDSGRGVERPYVARTAPAPPPAPEPPIDTSEYVFVRRDGGLLFAVAYSWDNGTLRYVTSDGVRKSVALESLDINATQQFNEQRGLSFRVPA